MLRVPDVDAPILEHLTDDANRLVIILNFVRTLDPVRIRSELTVDGLEKRRGMEGVLRGMENGSGSAELDGGQIGPIKVREGLQALMVMND